MELGGVGSVIPGRRKIAPAIINQYDSAFFFSSSEPDQIEVAIAINIFAYQSAVLATARKKAELVDSQAREPDGYRFAGAVGAQADAVSSGIAIKIC